MPMSTTKKMKALITCPMEEMMALRMRLRSSSLLKMRTMRKMRIRRMTLSPVPPPPLMTKTASTRETETMIRSNQFQPLQTMIHMCYMPQRHKRHMPQAPETHTLHAPDTHTLHVRETRPCTSKTDTRMQRSVSLRVLCSAVM